MHMFSLTIKGMFHIAHVFQSIGPLKPLYTSPPGRHVDSGTNAASLGSILARQQLRAKTKSLTFSPLSIARYSFIQLSRLRHHGENENAQTSKQ